MVVTCFDVLEKLFQKFYSKVQKITITTLVLILKRSPLVLLYHGIFHPFISHGIQVWGLTYKSYLDPILFGKRKL